MVPTSPNSHPAYQPEADANHESPGGDGECFRRAFDHAMVAMAIVEPTGEILVANRAFGGLVGATPDELAGRRLEDLIHPSDREAVRHGWQEIRTGVKPSVECEVRCLREDGALVRLRLSQAAVPANAGREGYLIAQAQDITEVHEGREASQRFLQELERSNRDLQEFARVASHDLQEPLRKIVTFGAMLDDSCGGTLGDEPRLYLSRMCDAATRMQRLINDLLIYSRVSSQPAKHALVDLGGVVQDLLEDLGDDIERSGATVELDALPTLHADPSRMRQLFHNLLTNALKYHRPDDPPRVAIGSEKLEEGSRDKYRIFVRDHGIGFDPKDADKIFEMFGRLHGHQEFEGTGLGLSLCRRIAEQHDGTLEAMSSPGRGATFTLTLPVPAGSEDLETT